MGYYYSYILTRIETNILLSFLPTHILALVHPWILSCDLPDVDRLTGILLYFCQFTGGWIPVFTTMWIVHLTFSVSVCRGIGSIKQLISSCSCEIGDMLVEYIWSLENLSLASFHICIDLILKDDGPFRPLVPKPNSCLIPSRSLKWNGKGSTLCTGSPSNPNELKKYFYKEVTPRKLKCRFRQYRKYNLYRRMWIKSNPPATLHHSAYSNNCVDLPVCLLEMPLLKQFGQYVDSFGKRISV